MRCRISEMTEVSALVVADDGGEATIQLAGTPFASLLRNARVGDTLAVVESHRARGVVFPTLAVLEPDLLIDVTTLCGCMKPYGFHALNSLLGRYESRVTTWQIELGNMANDFFDACVHDNAKNGKTLHERFMEAVTRSFRANALRYSAVEGIDAGFFHDAEQQFVNIYQTVHDTLPRIGVKLSDVILEPQFLSPELGLQGRLDALCHDTIIELKSGKADEFHGGKPKAEHELQMILYSEMLGRKGQVGAARKRNLLFYSRYPKLLAVSHTLYQLQTAIAVRNDIVALERDTREGRLADIMDALREADFNTSREDGKLYNNYMRPVIVRFLERMRSLPPLERAYFHTFAQFIAREQHICKTQFANVWLTPLAAQESEGEAVTGLTLHPVADMDGSIVELRAETAHDLTSTNFRRGDAVMLFESTEGGADFGTSREMGGGPGVGMGQEVGGGSGVGTIHSQIFRCQITGIAQHSIHLALAYKQRSESVFRPGREYAIAPSYMEATFSQSYKGLTALITSADDRRALLLGMRQPVNTAPPSFPQAGSGKADEFEYFLLVGPPGTGKTNVHLRQMVRRYLSQGQTLLVMAYTNQAVDEICGVLHEECPETYARIGNENSCAAPYRTRMMTNVMAGAGNRRQVLERLAELRVICGTIASIASHGEIFQLKRFDTTIVDEASQVLEPQLLPILCQVGRFVLIGDHKQLPAVVVQDRTESEVTDERLREIGLTNCANSYFERLFSLQERWGIGHKTTATLCRQGRMHRELMPFVNRSFYGDILRIVPLPHQDCPLPYRNGDGFKYGLGMRRNIFIDSEVKNHGASVKCNLHEAAVVADIVNEIQRLYAANGLTLNAARSVGVIVPFRAQITAIRNAISDRNLAEQLTIDTVERYQGSQRDIIIFDTVVTRPEQLDMISTVVRLADGTEIDRKLNVALTRAREQLIVVGHRPTLLRSRLYAELLDFLTETQ